MCGGFCTASRTQGVRNSIRVIYACISRVIDSKQGSVIDPKIEVTSVLKPVFINYSDWRNFVFIRSLSDQCFTRYRLSETHFRFS